MFEKEKNGWIEREGRKEGMKDRAAGGFLVGLLSIQQNRSVIHYGSESHNTFSTVPTSSALDCFGSFG